MGQLYVVRHAETHWNRERIVQGLHETTLTDWGEEQARLLAARLAGLDIQQVYSSPLHRAWATAEVLWEQVGVSGEIVAVPELQEMDFGELTGHQSETLKDTYHDWHRQWKGEPDLKAPGGESFRDVIQRVESFVERHLTKFGPEERILVVAHAGIVRALLIVLLGLSAPLAHQFHLDNASLTIFEQGGDTFFLKLWNSTSHLEPASFP